MSTQCLLIRLMVPLLMICLLSTQAVGQQLTPSQRQALKREVEDLVDKYKNNLPLTNDGVSIDPDMVSELRELFVETSRPVIHNFLLPEKIEGPKHVNPTGFVQYAQHRYPDGLDVSLEVTHIDIEDEAVKGAYRAVVALRLRAMGFYLGRRIHSYTGNQYLYIRANMDNDRVARIGIEQLVDSKRHANIQANRSVSGFYAGLSGGFGPTMIYNDRVWSSNDLGHSFGMTFAPTVELTYMLNRAIGFSMGIKLNQSRNYLSPKDTEQRFEPIKDTDGDIYEPIAITTDFEEALTVKTLDIPMILRFRMGRNTGFYFDVGAAYSTFRSASFTQEGTIETQGYYPSYQVTLKDIDDYGFSTVSVHDKPYSFDTPSSAISAIVGFGVTTPVYDLLTLRVGTSVRYGLSDLTTDTWTNPFLFGAAATSSGGESLLHSVNLEVGVSYRIYTHNP